LVAARRSVRQLFFVIASTSAITRVFPTPVVRHLGWSRAPSASLLIAVALPFGSVSFKGCGKAADRTQGFTSEAGKGMICWQNLSL
jgi:hypothetical protein